MHRSVLPTLALCPRFLKSQTIKSFVGFILAMSEAVKGKRLSDPCPVSGAVTALVDMLATLSRWVDNTPPVERSLRYGNPAFRHAPSHVAPRLPKREGMSLTLLDCAGIGWPRLRVQPPACWLAFCHRGCRMRQWSWHPT